jgi:MFS family permease
MFIASVAFPGMSRALNASVSELAWVSNGYIAGLTLVVPFSAWLTQRCGARRLVMLSLTLFSAAALACGLSDSLGSLIFWRALQGIGGGLLIPVGQSLTWQLFQPHERAKLSAAVMLVVCWPRPVLRQQVDCWLKHSAGAGSSWSACPWRWSLWR